MRKRCSWDFHLSVLFMLQLAGDGVHEENRMKMAQGDSVFVNISKAGPTIEIEILSSSLYRRPIKSDIKRKTGFGFREFLETSNSFQSYLILKVPLPFFYDGKVKEINQRLERVQKRPPNSKKPEDWWSQWLFTPGSRADASKFRLFISLVRHKKSSSEETRLKVFFFRLFK